MRIFYDHVIYESIVMSDYISNLRCPDLRPMFRHTRSWVTPCSMGHEVLSDWAEKSPDDPVFGIHRNSGFITRDEAAILYHCVQRVGGIWLDIGAATGWTAAHMALTAERVIAVEPMFWDQKFYRRFINNIAEGYGSLGTIMPWAGLSREFFTACYWNDGPILDGVMIDGDHIADAPVLDAQLSARYLKPTGIILLHDCTGDPQQAVRWLMDNGFHARVYRTPHLLTCCWRGNFAPPDHVPDPEIHPEEFPARYPFLDWSRMS